METIMRPRVVAIVLGLVALSAAVAQEKASLSYAAITARHPAARVSEADLARLRAEGECLAGVRALGSLPMDGFQPNIEWLNIRTQAMLALARPCEVLVMLEAAHDALGTSNAPSLRQ
jgi:hypothetical protein